MQELRRTYETQPAATKTVRSRNSRLLEVPAIYFKERCDLACALARDFSPAMVGLYVYYSVDSECVSRNLLLHTYMRKSLTWA